jgi:pyruvate,orthophosphate dikinase
VARQLGKPAVVGCSDVRINVDEKFFVADGTTVKEGDFISLNGAKGTVYLGKIAVTAPILEEQSELLRVLGWADELRRLMVWANADDEQQASRARSYGAQGIGLCRTEHMFLGDRTELFQNYILAPDADSKQKALEKLAVLQHDDFYGIFRAMDGLPVIIRLIDPPLHEFLPKRDELMVDVAIGHERGEDVAHKEFLLQKADELAEFNPMLGLRGIRLGIMLPDVTVGRCAPSSRRRATRPKTASTHPSHDPADIAHQRTQTASDYSGRRSAEGHGGEKGQHDYKFGTTIEIPRAALTASEIATLAQFFSFGTNDLTQMTYGISRDDAERHFLLQYVEKEILPKNPFQTIDRDGVGKLMKMCVEAGRATRPDLEVGICGEHGGDPDSIDFCHSINLNYVSCSPFRVPVARLAAAHAVLREQGWDRLGELGVRDPKSTKN